MGLLSSADHIVTRIGLDDGGKIAADIDVPNFLHALADHGRERGEDLLNRRWWRPLLQQGDIVVALKPDAHR
jgi:hypothetical protein